MGEAAALEGACALLLIDHVLAGAKTPDAGFAQRAQNIAARLKVSVEAPQALSLLPPAQLLDDDAQHMQTKGLLSQVQSEAAREIGRAHV